MKLSLPSVQKHPKSVKLCSRQAVPELFQCFLNTWTICLKVILWTRGIAHGGFPDSPFWYRCCIQEVMLFKCFFLAAYPASKSKLFQEDIHSVISATMICLPSKNFVQAWMMYFYFLTSPHDNRWRDSNK